MSHCIGLAATLEREREESVDRFGLVAESTEEWECWQRWLVERRAEM
jgi:hypothetical protein